MDLEQCCLTSDISNREEHCEFLWVQGFYVVVNIPEKGAKKKDTGIEKAEMSTDETQSSVLLQDKYTELQIKGRYYVIAVSRSSLSGDDL